MPNPVFASLPTSIFQHMTVLALKHDALNLGQGFPDQDGPIYLREVAAKQLIDGPNQYPPSKGLAVLRQAVSAHAAKFYGLDYRPGRRSADHLGRHRGRHGRADGDGGRGRRGGDDRAHL